jgi:hypothetical protein
MPDIVETIGKLLIQAERSSNEAEQDAYFKMAQKKASQYSVELEVARQSVTNKELRETPVSKKIQIGERGKPLNATFCELFMSIGRAQDLKFNIAHNSTYIIAFGFPSDIRVTEAMYSHVSVQMVEMANAFIKGGTWKGDTTWDARTFRHKPVHSRVARRCFYEAFTKRIGLRLREAKREAEKDLKDEMVSVTDGVGTDENADWNTVSKELVMKGKEVEVSDFYHRNSDARGSWKGSSNTYTSSSGYSSGRNAADNARLGGQQSLPGTRKKLD